MDLSLQNMGNTQLTEKDIKIMKFLEMVNNKDNIFPILKKLKTLI